MNGSPAVTGIIIFLNGEKYLAEAIESVLAQTFTDWELLLCDDGSTDGATAIAREYAARYPGKIRYLEHPNHENRGMSATRNMGIRASRGRYIAMLDADDIWTASKLQEQYDILQAHPEVAMVYGPMKLWYSWTGRPQDDRRDRLQPLGVPADSVARPPELLLSFMRDPACHVCGLLTRKDVLEKVGLYEEEFRTEYEDVIVQSKISVEYPVYASSRCWYWYRQHDDSCTSATRRNWQQKPARLKYLNKFEQYLLKKNITSGPVWDELQRQLKPFRQKLRYAVEQAGARAAVAGRWVIKQLMPAPVAAWARAKYWGHSYTPPRGWVRFGSLRRLSPVAPDFGIARGTTVDRFYVDRFLSAHSATVCGRVLEIGNSTHADSISGRDIQKRVSLPLSEDPAALSEALRTMGDAQFDCVILPNTLARVYDHRAVLRETLRLLRPGGVVLATLPSISQISRYDQVRWGDYWRFTSRSARLLFEEFLPGEAVQVESHGNVMAAVAMMHGICVEELRAADLNTNDPEYEVILTVCAVKPIETPAPDPNASRVHLLQGVVA